MFVAPSLVDILISIHAPREGSDFGIVALGARLAQFLSTLPARGATNAPGHPATSGSISIHAPREGSDAKPFVPDACVGPISIHAPREGSDKPRRPVRCPGSISIHAPREGSDGYKEANSGKRWKFLSTLPARGATRTSIGPHWQTWVFLSTLPARGATVCRIRLHGRICNFYPRSPRGERQFAGYAYMAGYAISIHAPREGSDAAGFLRHRSE